MITIVLLAVLAIGVLIGARGMKALGRSLRGPWRPGAATLGIIAAFAALALAARAQALEAAIVAVVAVALLVLAARRRGPAPPSLAGMDRAEAASVLGVAPTATAAEIDAAYRRLMRLAHPDAGGTSGLARRLTEARAVLKQ